MQPHVGASCRTPSYVFVCIGLLQKRPVTDLRLRALAHNGNRGPIGFQRRRRRLHDQSQIVRSYTRTGLRDVHGRAANRTPAGCQRAGARSKLDEAGCRRYGRRSRADSLRQCRARYSGAAARAGYRYSLSPGRRNNGTHDRRWPVDPSWPIEIGQSELATELATELAKLGQHAWRVLALPRGIVPFDVMHEIVHARRQQEPGHGDYHEPRIQRIEPRK